MKLKSSLSALIILLSFNVAAEVIDLSIRYLGIRVVDVTMSDDKECVLNITAKATPFASIASNMDNFYSSVYRGNYLPDQYRKRIDQKDYFEDRIVDYDRENLIARRVSFIDSSRTSTYQIMKESRDFFSALFSLRSEEAESGILWLDAGTSIWKGYFTLLEIEKISTVMGKRRARKYQITFDKISSHKQERSDMLTNNLVDEEKSLYLWITDDEQAIPVKAKFRMKPFSVTWKLEHYEE